jgi:hypothetical protein
MSGTQQISDYAISHVHADLVGTPLRSNLRSCNSCWLLAEAQKQQQQQPPPQPTSMCPNAQLSIAASGTY